MADYKDDYTEDWEGKTGSYVASTIQSGLSTHGAGLNSQDKRIKTAIKDILFDVDSTTSTVTCKVIKEDDSEIEGTTTNKHKFTLKAVSTATATLNIDDYTTLAENKTICKYGSSFSFTYDWEIRNTSNSKCTGGTGTLYVTVKDSAGNAITYDKGSLPVTKTGSNTLSVVTLNADELPEGTSTITVSIKGSYGGSDIYLATDPTFKLNVLNPVLDVTFDDADGIDVLRDIDDKFNWYFSVTNSKGKALTINGANVTNITKHIQYGAGTILDTTNSLEEWSITDIKGSDSTLNGRQRVYVWAEITMGGITILSNTVMIYFMCNNATDANYTWYSLQLNNVTGSKSGAPTINVNLYDNTKFSIKALSKVANNLTYLLIKDGDTSLLTTKSLTANTLTDITYSYIFKSTGTHTFRIIDEHDNSLSINVSVNSIGSSIGELTSQVVELSASGKLQSDHTWKYGSIETDFDNNFDWSGNGWIDDGLLVNNGATAVINYAPFSTGVFTASFRINTSNSIDSECLISCISGNTGFAIYPEKATFQINGTGISTEFNSTETHEITFVRYGSSYGNLISIYVDGSIQLSKSIADDASAITAPITITSENTQLYVYNVNVFKLALSFTNVLAIYCFNQTNSSDIISYISNNNVFDSGSTMTTIGYKDGQVITPESLPVGARYLIISEYNNGGTCLDPEPWKTIDDYPGAEAEKYKGIYHLVGNVKLIEKVADGEAPSARNFLVDKATLAAQGTSSMAYPLKNFRLAFAKPIDSSCAYYNASGGSSDPKAGDFGYSTVLYTGVAESDVITLSGSSFSDYKTTYTGTADASSKVKYPIRSSKKFKGDDEVVSADAKIFCLKADYAESSGSHNTGFARLVNDALTNSSNIYSTKETNSILPQQYVVNSLGKDAIYSKDIRSTIDGFPIYLFFELSDGTILYHGKYNFNNEKSSKDVFGFEKISDYFNNQIVKNESNVLKELFNDTVGYYDSTHFSYGITSAGEFEDDETKVSLDYINPTECWEFSNNTFDIAPSAQNVIGAFQYPYTTETSHDSFAYPKASTYPNCNPFTVKDSDGNLAWLSQAWEYRYPGLDDGSAGDLNYRNGICKPYLLDSLYKWLYKHNSTLIDNGKEDVVNDFAENLHKYFNVNYLLKYFVLTKWFGNVDQRIKNCMLSFYCDPTVDSNTDIDSPMGHMRAFYIFYDNDTINGVDNAGTLTLDWDVDEDAYPGYGKHAIWDNLEYCYNYYVNGKTEYSYIRTMGELVEKAYKSIRTVITDDKLTKYFETDLVNKFPDAIHNLDAEVKYYYVGDINNTTTNFASSNIAKLQGNRKYHRKRWLKKRTNWLDAKFIAGNIDLYSYQFKVGGTSSSSQPGGNIKLTSALNNWRFHITDSTSKLDISSNLLAKDSYANLTINANSFSISDFVLIEALYGCSAIDFTNFKTSTWFLDLSNGGNILPYMKTFTMNDNTNSANPKKFSSAAFSKLLTTTDSEGKTSSIFPNLEELNLCYTQISTDSGEASTRLPEVDLSTFSKLSKIDFTGTDVDVVLPNSGLLTLLILESPNKLNITNKPNITKLSIGTTNLNTLTVGAGNNSYVYDWALTTISNKYSTTGFTSNLILGTKDNYYHVTSSEIELLVAIAIAKPSNVTISGYLYNPTISVEDVDLLTSVYPDLTISQSTTTNLEFRLSDPAILYEGGSLTIALTSGILESSDNWYWEIYDTTTNTWVAKNSLGDLITEDSDNKTRTKLILKAAISGTNNNATYRLRVGAYYTSTTEPTMYENEIPVLYVAVTKITLSAEKSILSAGLITTINMSYYPTTCTKTDWILSHATWNVSGGSVSTNNNVISFTKDSGENDGTIAVSSLGDIETNSLTIIYDKTLYTYTVVSAESNSNSVKWIHNLLYAKYGAIANSKDPIKVSTLNEITLTNDTLDSLAYSYVDSGGASTTVAQDLTYLLYCKFSDPQFTIPSTLLFTDLSIPSVKGLTGVVWNSTSMDYTSFGTITFPEYLETAIITISNEFAKYNSLCLDFSKTKITKIYNGNGTCDSMAASVSFTYNIGQAGSTPSLTIFKLPSTLVTLGNYVEKDNWTDTYQTIFNLNSPGTTVYNLLYLLPTNTSVKKLGPLYNYKILESVNASSQAFLYTASNFTHLYHAFENNGLPNGNTTLQDFTNVLQIGNSSFKDQAIETLNINHNATDIGNLAFMSFNGTLKTQDSTTISGALVFDLLSTIGDYAFATVSSALTLEIKGLSKIGEYAFVRKDGDTFTHKIYINLTTAFEFKGTSFGTGNTIYMPTALLTELKKSSEWSNLSSNVTIETL